MGHVDDKISLNMSVNDDSARSDENLKHLTRSISLRSYNKWSPTEHGVTLAWRDLSIYAAKNNGKTIKRIINTATGAITSGSLVALMGSSGSGKTTLMSSLAHRNSPGTIVNGDILVNGCEVSDFMKRLSGFVHQDDLFFGSLTVMEHMKCMAHLKLDRRVNSNESQLIIRDILERTGLMKCSNTRIGEDGEGKMLSGGEKKRLAFATELLTQPAILFCDEPTTGLDSYNAQKLVETLQELAERRNTAIMCTIHQPSSQLFAMFDQVMFLAEGRVAFFGEPDDALEFFGENGYKCPKNYNPADYMIGVLSTDVGSCERTSHKISGRLCDLFAVSEMSQQRDLLVNLEMHMFETGNYLVNDELAGFKPPLWHKTLYWLIWRSLLSVIRDPTVQYLRIIQKIAIAVMAGLCFTGSINLTQPGVQAIEGIIFIFVSENTFTPMYSVLSIFPQSFPIFLREIKSGLYSTGQYYLANVIAMLPGLVVEPLVFVMIAYWLAQLRSTFFAFFITALASILVMNVSTACGCFFSAAFNSVPLAMAYLVPFDYVLMITSGVFIKLATLPNYLSWMPYLSWLMYGTEAMNIVQWDGVTNITCVSKESTELPCYSTGEEVLDRYNFSPDHLYINLVAMFLLYICFHLLGYLFLFKRTKKL